MHKSFRIENFRCFEDLKLDQLKRINLIAGKNNVGKTAVLEALFVHSGAFNPDLAVRLNGFRGVSKVQISIAKTAIMPWHPLFNKFDASNVITFTSVDEYGEPVSMKLKEVSEIEELKQAALAIQPEVLGNGSIAISATTETIRALRLEYERTGQRRVAHAIMDNQGLHIEVVPPAPFQTVFLFSRGRVSSVEEADRFTKLVSSGKKQLLLDGLSILEPRLKNIELLTFTGETTIHGDIGMGRPVPILFMGDGLMRLASVILAIAESPDGIVLIDEIENGLHFSVLKEVWRAINLVAGEFNTQVFATTHSFECVRAAHEAFTESAQYDFKYLRLDRTKAGNIRVVDYDEETMQTAIESGFEVR